MSGRLSEYNKCQIENLTITTAASVNSKPVNMEEADKVTFLVGYGTAAANLPITAQARIGGDSGLSTSTTIGSAITIGSTAANTVTNALQAVITVSSATTDAETLVINGTSFVTSTAAVATSLQFGSTAGTTAASGIDAIVRSLTSLINANLPKLTATTISTVAVRIRVNDTASTMINITSTGANLAPAYEKAQGVLEFKASDLNSTSKWIGVTLSSGATAIQCSVASIKSCARYGAPFFKGSSYTST